MIQIVNRSGNRFRDIMINVPMESESISAESDEENDDGRQDLRQDGSQEEVERQYRSAFEDQDPPADDG